MGGRWFWELRMWWVSKLLFWAIDALPFCSNGTVEAFLNLALRLRSEEYGKGRESYHAADCALQGFGKCDCHRALIPPPGGGG